MSQHNISAFTDAAAAAVARAIAGVQRDAQREREVQDAEYRARLAGLDTLFAEVRSLERQLADRLASVKDGAPGPAGEPGPAGADADMALVRTMIDEAVAAAVSAIPPAENGKDADPALIAELVSLEVAKIPPAPAGKDADPTIIRQMVQEAVAELPAPEAGPAGEPGERGPEGPAGKLPVVKEWDDRVHYEGSVVVLGGATYQATRDTGRAPPHEDWRCIARAGQDGRDGRTFRICGTYAEGVEHLALDVVALNGASFVAKFDNPGACPGEGWQMIASQGKRGNQGERGAPGARGERGVPGPSVISADIDGDGILSLNNADGTSTTCDLYPVLSQLTR